MALIASIMTKKPEMTSRTYADWSTFLGENTKRLGLLSRMQPYDEMTASYLTQAMGNIIKNKENSGNKYQKIDALSFSWEIEQNWIEYIEFAQNVTDNGLNGSEITMYFDRKYYGQDDTFIIETTKQQCFVLDEPRRVSEKCWEYHVRLLANDREATLITSACYKGAKTRWLGNLKPELHETGNVKFQSNAQQLRQWISEIRVQTDYSHRYSALEKTFVKLSKGSEANGWSHKIFEWPERKKLLMDNFMAARNQAMLWQRGTMDQHGHCTVTDRQGRDIIAGDGIIPQIERFASKFNFTKLSVNYLNEMILDLSSKSRNVTGNSSTRWARAA